MVMGQKRRNTNILEDFIYTVRGKQNQGLYNFFSSRLILGTVCCCTQLDVKLHSHMLCIYLFLLKGTGLGSPLLQSLLQCQLDTYTLEGDPGSSFHACIIQQPSPISSSPTKSSLVIPPVGAHERYKYEVQFILISGKTEATKTRSDYNPAAVSARMSPLFLEEN